VYPDYITGLEIQKGEITLVWWTARLKAGTGKELRLQRELLAPPQRLALLR
jgi:hypothetical protein